MVDREQAATLETVERLLGSLFEEPDIPGIRLTDPRFRWVRKTYPGIPREADTLAGMVDALLAQPPERVPFLPALLEHLIDYIDYLRNVPLEDELLGIVAALSPARNTAPMLARYGWAGSRPVTLQDAAAMVGVTRERIRQIEQRFERVCAERPVWTPVLDRALEVAANHAPTMEVMFATRLRRSGLTASDSFSIEGLVTAQGVFGKPHRLGLRRWQGAPILVRVDELGADDFIELLEQIRTAAVKLVNNQGMATVDEVVQRLGAEDCRVEAADAVQALRLCDSVEVVDDRWLFHPSTDSRNPLANRLDKMLVFWPSLPVDVAVTQLARESREQRRYVPSDEGLVAFATWRPEYEVDDGRIVRPERQTLNDVLSEGELAIARYILARDEPPDFTSIVRDLERPGLSRINIAVILGQSPVIHRYGFRKTYRYALLTPSSLGHETDEIGIDDDLAELAGHQALDELVVEEPPEVHAGPGAHSEPAEGPAGGHGEVALQTDDGTIPYPPLEVALRKMLSVYSPLPLTIAKVQLCR